MPWPRLLLYSVCWRPARADVAFLPPRGRGARPPVPGDSPRYGDRRTGPAVAIHHYANQTLRTMRMVQRDEGRNDTDRYRRPRDGITNVVKRGEISGRRQVKPHKSHPALRRAQPGELPSLGVEGGGDAG